MPKVGEKTRLSELLEARLKEKGMTLGALQKEMNKRLPDGCTYETVRRWINAGVPPSRYTLSEICKVLKLPFEEVDKVMRVDKMHEEYADLVPEISHKKPGMEPLERVWDTLSEDQQQAVIGMARELAKRSRASGG